LGVEGRVASAAGPALKYIKSASSFHFSFSSIRRRAIPIFFLLSSGVTWDFISLCSCLTRHEGNPSPLLPHDTLSSRIKYAYFIGPFERLIGETESRHVALTGSPPMIHVFEQVAFEEV